LRYIIVIDINKIHIAYSVFFQQINLAVLSLCRAM